MEPKTFISAKVASKLLHLLVKCLNKSFDNRNKELIRISDTFGNCIDLAQYYIQPNCQQVNPADELEDETISTLRAGVFKTVNEFFHRDIVTRDGASQMFILADAGMGKTSLLMMLKLTHLMSFWPKEYQCELLKLDGNTLDNIEKLENKSKTILLLDSLDEDPQCKDGETNARLTQILEVTTVFYRVIITCRTQFFPETLESAFKSLGKISFKNYDCPLIYLSLFTNEQVDLYLKKRYPKKLHFLLNKFTNPKIEQAKEAINNIGSLQFRPFLLSHVETLLESYQQGADEYELYKGLVRTWLNREVIKLREKHNKDVNEKDLLKACVWLAERMHRNDSHTVSLKHIKQICSSESSVIHLEDSVERVIDGINHIDIGTNSLLNRNSFGEFRFSHLSIREFLIVYGVEMGIIKDENPPFNKTDKILTFIESVNATKVGLFKNSENGHLLNKFTLNNEGELFDMNLENASLRSAVLNGALLREGNLRKADLRNANLEGANLEGANLEGANLEGANLVGANLSRANLREVNLTHACINGVNFNKANLSKANLQFASLYAEDNIIEQAMKNLKNINGERQYRLRGKLAVTSTFSFSEILATNFNQAILEAANLSDADLRYSEFVGADLREVKAQNAKFSEANLSKAILDKSDFNGANFENAKLTGTHLLNSSLVDANLTNVSFLEANLRGCDLTSAELIGSSVSLKQMKEAVIRVYDSEYGEWRTVNYLEKLRYFNGSENRE